VIGSKMGKAELHDLPCSGRVAQMLVSKFCNMQMGSLIRIDASQTQKENTVNITSTAEKLDDIATELKYMPQNNFVPISSSE